MGKPILEYYLVQFYFELGQIVDIRFWEDADSSFSDFEKAHLFSDIDKSLNSPSRHWVPCDTIVSFLSDHLKSRGNLSNLHIFSKLEVDNLGHPYVWQGKMCCPECSSKEVVRLARLNALHSCSVCGTALTIEASRLNWIGPGCELFKSLWESLPSGDSFTVSAKALDVSDIALTIDGANISIEIR